MAVRPKYRRLSTVAAAALAFACGPRENPSAGTVHALARSANRRDAAAIVAALAPDFRGPAGMRRDDLDAELRRLFTAYAAVNVSVTDVTVDPLPDLDVVRFRAAFRGTPRKIGGLAGILPSSASYRFELRLSRDGERRTVTAAEWQEVGE